MKFFAKSFFLLFAIVAIALILQQHLVEAKNRKSKQKAAFDRKFKQKKEEAYSLKCSHIADQTLAKMCVYYYIHPVCYKNAFGSRGLELGEISSYKESDFSDCYKTQERQIDSNKKKKK